MKLAAIIEEYLPHLREKNRAFSSDQYSAINAILGCRTPQYGLFKTQCQGCAEVQYGCHSCGHRSCPRCQQHTARQWLERQSQKLLPCPYFMATFTLPQTYRALALKQPAMVYDCLLLAAKQTLMTFAKNSQEIGSDIGITAVLHTHTRRLDFHPHVHCIVPGGGLEKNEWRSRTKGYLFNGRALAKVFRGIFIRLLKANTDEWISAPKKWIVQCQSVGSGLPALKYLSRYLYRSVISEKNIIANRDGQVTFRYKDGKTQKNKTRTMPGDEFVWLLMQHVLPKGFRRVRDYGIVHGNARAKRQRLQLVLKIQLPPIKIKEPVCWQCEFCKGIKVVVARNIRHHDAPD